LFIEDFHEGVAVLIALLVIKELEVADRPVRQANKHAFLQLEGLIICIYCRIVVFVRVEFIAFFLEPKRIFIIFFAASVASC